MIDSLSEIRMLAQSSLRYRRQVLALKHKERPENKIDGAIALIMALGRHMTPPSFCAEALIG